MKTHHPMKEKLLSKVFIIPCALSMITIVYVILNIAYFKTGTVDSAVVAALMGLSACLLVFFAAILVHLHRDQVQQQLAYELEEAQLEYVDKLLSVMEEQRNDILNAISVVTVYLQLGKYDKAQKYLELMAAEQTDKIDFHKKTWFDDPWEAVLDQKQEQALRQGILFTVEQKTPPPEDDATRRLIARLMANLIEEAFRGVAELQNPRVWLYWYLDSGKPVLEIKKSRLDSDIVSEASGASEYMQPKNEHWRIPICRQIASEVGGTLSVTQTSQSTIYRFELQ